MRSDWPRLIAVTLRIVGNLSVAEDIVQDILVTALDRWPLTGTPDNPSAWLMTACRNRALNELRDRSRRERNVLQLRPLVTPPDGRTHAIGEISDDRLRLIVMCCHPSLPVDAQVALTLRMVTGLTSEEIARGFNLPVATLQQRLVRAKRTLTANRISFATDDPDLASRLPAVLDVIYLVFNEGYLSTTGSSLTRGDLAAEAFRLATLLTELAPEDGEAWALHALPALQLSRVATRTNDDGQLLTLEHQDRDRWNHDLIRIGMQSLTRASIGPRSAMLIQAELAACHATAPAYADTDWSRIVALYDELLELQGSAVVALNRAVAVAMTAGPETALAILDELAADPSLTKNHRLWSVRAEMNKQARRLAAAVADYDKAIELASNDVERRHLQNARSAISST